VQRSICNDVKEAGVDALNVRTLYPKCGKEIKRIL